MKRHIPGLHSESKNAEDYLEGLFLVRVDHVNYTVASAKAVLLDPLCQCSNQRNFAPAVFQGGSIALRRLFGGSTGSFATSDTTRICLAATKWTKRLWSGSEGSVRTSRKTLAGRSFQNLDGFAPSAEWESLSTDRSERIRGKEGDSHDLQLHTD